MAKALDGIDVAVLAGGLGTRLAAAVPGLPKALAPVAGVPFVEHLLDWLTAQGAQRIAAGGKQLQKRRRRRAARREERAGRAGRVHIGARVPLRPPQQPDEHGGGARLREQR